MPPGNNGTASFVPTLNTAKLWKSSAYSDLTIKFSGRELRCHTVVLCDKSEYFMELCGPDAKFKETDASIIELKDDDPDALEATLEYLYKGSYDADRKPWTIHLEVAMTADKYLLPSLERWAVERLTAHTNSVVGPVEAIFEMITTVRSKNAKDSVKRISQGLEKKHIQKLIGLPAYRATIEEDKDGMWDLLCELAGDGPKHIDVYIARCIHGGCGGLRASPRTMGSTCPLCGKASSVLKLHASRKTMQAIHSTTGRSAREVLLQMGWL